MSGRNARRAYLLHQVACVFACFVIALFAFAAVPTRAMAEDEEPALVAAESEQEEAAVVDEAEAAVEAAEDEEPALVAAAPAEEEAEPVAAEPEPVVSEPEEEIELVVAAPDYRNTWVDDGSGWSYYDASGNKVYGWLQVGGEWYFINRTTGYLEEHCTFFDGGKQYVSNEKGVCTTNSWVQVGSDWYRTGTEHGQVVTGWCQVNGKWYYMDSNGICKLDQMFTANGKYYIADKYGACYTNQWVKTSANLWYFCINDCSVLTGWLLDGKVWYYLDPDANGAMVCDTTKTIGGKDYKFDKSGALVTGWVQESGIWWYYDPDTGAEVSGWVKYKDDWYYIDETNGMVDDKIFNAGGKAYIAKPGGVCPDNEWVKKDGYWYYTDDNCAISSGWVKYKDDWYYLDPDSSNFGKMKSATIFNDGYNDYIAGNDGVCPQEAWVSFGGNWYYCDDNCALHKGWLKYKDDWYYMDPSTHVMVTNTTIDGYKIGPDGRWIP